MEHTYWGAGTRLHHSGRGNCCRLRRLGLGSTRNGEGTYASMRWGGTWDGHGCIEGKCCSDTAGDYDLVRPLNSALTIPLSIIRRKAPLPPDQEAGHCSQVRRLPHRPPRCKFALSVWRSAERHSTGPERRRQGPDGRRTDLEGRCMSFERRFLCCGASGSLHGIAEVFGSASA